MGGHTLTVALATMGRGRAQKGVKLGAMVIMPVRDKWTQPRQWGAEKQDTSFLLPKQRFFCLNQEPSEQSWMHNKDGGASGTVRT